MTHLETDKPWKPTEEMIQAEKDLCGRLAAKWNCSVEKQHDFSVLDAIAHRDNKPFFFVELRIIKYGYHDLDDIMISLKKCFRAKSILELTGLPSFFVVHWTKDDTIGLIDLNKVYYGEPDFRVSKKNMKRLNKPDEIEVCRHVRVSQFKVLTNI